MTDQDISTAAETLKAAGWTVLPPAAEELPRVEVGQVWVSPNPKIEPRTVTKIGKHRSMPWAERCIAFTTPRRQGERSCRDPKVIYYPVLTEQAFVAWARKAQARPVAS